MDVSLDGKVAAVTGEGAGLGRAYARELARRGARLVLNGLAGDGVRVTAEPVRAGGADAVVAEGDVAGRTTGESLLKAAPQAYGTFDVLVDNAGITRHRMTRHRHRPGSAGRGAGGLSAGGFRCGDL